MAMKPESNGKPKAETSHKPIIAMGSLLALLGAGWGVYNYAFLGGWCMNGHCSKPCATRHGKSEVRGFVFNLVFKNECGIPSTGHFTGISTVVADDWPSPTGKLGLVGHVSKFGNRIDWENKDYWIHSPGASSDSK